jgi:cell division protein FtsL
MSDARTHFNLAGLIIDDLLRSPLQFILYVLVLLSAAGVILSAHHNRQMAIALESTMQQKDQLDVQWRNLILEQSALTEHNRIEDLVQKQLNMHRPSPEEEIVVRVR